MKDIPQKEKDALILSLTGISDVIVEAKRKVLIKRSWKAAAISGAATLVPVPGLSTAVDAALIAEEVIFYRKQFGLNTDNLKHLSIEIKREEQFLQNMLKTSGSISQLAAKEILKTILSNTVKYGSAIAAEEAVLFIDSRIVRRMMCESMLSTNAEIAQITVALVNQTALRALLCFFFRNTGT